MDVHRCVQELVQADLTPPLHRTHKHKHGAILTTLLQLRTLGADWADGIENNDYERYSTKVGHSAQRRTGKRLESLQLVHLSSRTDGHIRAVLLSCFLYLKNSAMD